MDTSNQVSEKPSKDEGSIPATIDIIDYSDPLNPKPAESIHPLFPSVISLIPTTPAPEKIITHGDYSSY